MPFSTEDQVIADEALAYAKANKKPIARRLTDPNIYPPEENPVSVFMAGSPGAGKTEASLELISQFGNQVLRIDADELRSEFKAYQGRNAWLFQAAVSVLVEKVHDFALRQGQSFVLDGTLANYDLAEKNIRRSLGKDRFVQILYVYQKPELAWKFVQARERLEGRNIPLEEFIRQYFSARDVVNRLKEQFGKVINVDLLLKNTDGSNRVYKANIDKIDYHVPETYGRESLEQVLQSEA